ncbi:hypothetical protein [Candidatus Poriferisodalis sp.]|uniref:hypothetical protein n=1 Tax=Candidatus Poriferisodalis sp. TaxID=3101277 RepID=UPI003B0163D1
MKNVDGSAVRLVDADDETLAGVLGDGLAVTLGGIAAACCEGLMAVAVEAGLATALAVMTQEADALGGAWNARYIDGAKALNSAVRSVFGDRSSDAARLGSATEPRPSACRRRVPDHLRRRLAKSPVRNSLGGRPASVYGSRQVV